jgi:hypothetical protein
MLNYLVATRQGAGFLPLPGGWLIIFIKIAGFLSLLGLQPNRKRRACFISASCAVFT